MTEPAELREAAHRLRRAEHVPQHPKRPRDLERIKDTWAFRNHRTMAEVMQEELEADARRADARVGVALDRSRTP